MNSSMTFSLISFISSLLYSPRVVLVKSFALVSLCDNIEDDAIEDVRDVIEDFKGVTAIKDLKDIGGVGDVKGIGGLKCVGDVKGLGEIKCVEDVKLDNFGD